MLERYSFDSENKVWVKKDYTYRVEYSDGYEIENRIFESIKNSKDVSVLSDELETKISDWTSLCFLSKKRSNLLRPFASHFKGKYILEVGCGAGPITRFLGESGAFVVGIEPSMQRAKMAAERCRDLENVWIVCDDAEGFEADIKFDGIVQVGVLEYATKYSNDKNAPLNYINSLKRHLKEDGFLITAIENQLGLKYLAGFAEDHLGVAMHGINDNYQQGEATTFGRKTLISLFEEAGFASNETFLPFPDYKMPTLIFYPDFYSKNKDSGFNIESILSNISYQDSQKNTPLFSLDKALPLITRNGLLYDLSNSFCLFSQLSKEKAFDEAGMLALYNTDRKKEFCKETIFRKTEGEVQVVRHHLADHLSINKEKPVISFPVQEPAFPGTLYHFRLVEILNRNNWTVTHICDWLAGWLKTLQKELLINDQIAPGISLHSKSLIKGKYIDAIPTNLIVNEELWHFIDLEVDMEEKVEIGYLMFRSLYVSFSRIANVAPPSEDENLEFEKLINSIYLKMGFDLNAQILDNYYELEAKLVSSVSPRNVKTLKGSLIRLKARPKIDDILHNQQDNLNLQKEIASLKQELMRKEKEIFSLKHNALSYEDEDVFTGEMRPDLQSPTLESQGDAEVIPVPSTRTLITAVNLEDYAVEGFYDYENGMRWTNGSSSIKLSNKILGFKEFEVCLKTYLPSSIKSINPDVFLFNEFNEMLQYDSCIKEGSNFIFKFSSEAPVYIQDIQIKAETFDANPPDIRVLSFPFVSLELKPYSMNEEGLPLAN